MATLRIELDIEVRPYTAEEAVDEGFDAEGYDPADQGEIDASEIAHCIAAMFGEGSEAIAEVFAGSNLLVHLGEATVIRSEITP